MSDWVLGESQVFESRYRRCEKKHPEETRAMLNNLDTYHKTLNSGVNPAQIKIVASILLKLNQVLYILNKKESSPSIKMVLKEKPTQTRLYIYPDEQTRTVFTITIGEKGKKKVQNKDVQFCCEFVERLKKERK